MQSNFSRLDTIVRSQTFLRESLWTGHDHKFLHFCQCPNLLFFNTHLIAEKQHNNDTIVCRLDKVLQEQTFLRKTLWTGHNRKFSHFCRVIGQRIQAERCNVIGQNPKRSKNCNKSLLFCNPCKIKKFCPPPHTFQQIQLAF